MSRNSLGEVVGDEYEGSIEGRREKRTRGGGGGGRSMEGGRELREVVGAGVWREGRRKRTQGGGGGGRSLERVWGEEGEEELAKGSVGSGLKLEQSFPEVTLTSGDQSSRIHIH